MAMYQIGVLGMIAGQKHEITYQRWVESEGRAFEEGLALARNSEANDPAISVEEISEQLMFCSEIRFPNGKISKRTIAAYSPYDARRKTLLYCQKTDKQYDEIVISDA